MSSSVATGEADWEVNYNIIGSLVRYAPVLGGRCYSAEAWRNGRIVDGVSRGFWFVEIHPPPLSLSFQSPVQH